MRWRWDQGRLDYFRYSNILLIAKTLAHLENAPLNTSTDLIRQPLEEGTGLPFAPTHYKVWRNYARVFNCSMLATCSANRLVITDLCRKLIESPDTFSPDEYFNFVFSHFTLPFPAFDDYNSKVAPLFPFVAIIKFVSARQEKGATLDDIFSYVVGNNCTGLESIDFYKRLTPTSRKPMGDEKRQVREMLVFMGQASYLKWFDSQLYVDSLDYPAIQASTTPSVRSPRHKNPQEEFLSLTAIPHRIRKQGFDIALKDRELHTLSFYEGGKVFVTHGKIERSPMVRKRYFESHPEIICDACSVNTQKRYPWTENILELHHILPLAATLNVNGTTTVLDDMVPLCPSCHKSIHAFYRIKLDEHNEADFSSKQRAKEVYEWAKREIRL